MDKDRLFQHFLSLDKPALDTLMKKCRNDDGDDDSSDRIKRSHQPRKKNRKCGVECDGDSDDGEKKKAKGRKRKTVEFENDSCTQEEKAAALTDPKIRRRLQNRRAAKTSRARKKAYINLLEEKTKLLEDKVFELVERNKKLEDRLKALETGRGERLKKKQRTLPTQRDGSIKNGCTLGNLETFPSISSVPLQLIDDDTSTISMNEDIDERKRGKSSERGPFQLFGQNLRSKQDAVSIGDTPTCFRLDTLDQYALESSNLDREKEARNEFGMNVQGFTSSAERRMEKPQQMASLPLKSTHQLFHHSEISKLNSNIKNHSLDQVTFVLLYLVGIVLSQANFCSMNRCSWGMMPKQTTLFNLNQDRNKGTARMFSNIPRTMFSLPQPCSMSFNVCDTCT
mmetsp:Transcript_44226/g.71083  ORF Transcript_44226/g.71083 Transcript_44226/m.71083 type:complete len:397 (-) Transcript_44226:92-1282(-)